MRRGDEVAITVETRWAEAGIPTTALDFTVREPSMIVMDNWSVSGHSGTVYVDPIPETQALVDAAEGKSK